MRRTVLLAAVCLALAGCSSSSDVTTDAKASATPSPTPSETAFTIEDCKSMLEANFAADANTDVSEEPECADLTEEEYVQAVGDVLTGHKDDILDDAADQVVYDDAWEALDAEAQATTCDLLEADGPASVGVLLGETVEDPSINTAAMAEYLYAEKC
jgi:hypothetical protein